MPPRQAQIVESLEHRLAEHGGESRFPTRRNGIEDQRLERGDGRPFLPAAKLEQGLGRGAAHGRFGIVQHERQFGYRVVGPGGELGQGCCRVATHLTVVIPERRRRPPHDGHFLFGAQAGTKISTDFASALTDIRRTSVERSLEARRKVCVRAVETPPSQHRLRQAKIRTSSVGS